MRTGLSSLIGLVLLLVAPSASSLSREDRQRLDQFARSILEKRDWVAGYPVNQNADLDEFYDWYTRNRLYRGVMNNVGNPQKKSPYTLNTHPFETEVVDYFADLFGFREGQYWGFVTAGGTDGNNHGLYFGHKSLQSKSKEPPIVYVSKEAHYSIKKLVDVQNAEIRLIRAQPMGQMDLGDFERQLEPDRPALVVVALGTTFKGAIDDQEGIRRILRTRHRGPAYIHLDAALFGGFLPYADGDAWKFVNQLVQQFDSIAVSGHKFFGFDEPTGIFLATRDTYERLNPFQVPYLNDAVPTISCSRSALSPLKFWWKIHSKERSDYRRTANTLMADAETIWGRLQESGIRAWKNDYSNTVFFERPSGEIMRRYDLAPEEDPEFGRLAHLVVMPHIHPLIERFIHDMQTWKRAH